MTSVKHVLIAFLVLLLVGCATTKRDWEKARSFNTVEAYDEFLTKHPQSEFTADAKSRIQELDWQNAKRLDTLREYQKFITMHPQSGFTQEAKRRIEDLEWDEAQRLNTLEAYQEFLQRYPVTPHRKEAQLRMEELSFTIARDENTIPSYNSFLKSYPYSKFAEAARKARDSLQRIESISSSEKTTVTQIFEHGPQSRFVVKDLVVQEKAKKGITSFTFGGPPIGTALVIFEQDRDKKGYSTKSNVAIFGLSVSGFEGNVPDLSNMPKGAVTRFLGRVDFGNCSLEACVFNGEVDNPLSFVWVPNEGFVYLGGNGSVELRNGRKVILP